MAAENDGGSNPASDAAKAVAVGTVTGAAVTGATAAGATTALGAVGFSSTGVVAGSIAAGIQSSMGSVAAGSWFATATSMAMGGTAVLPFAVAAGAIAGTGAGLGFGGYKLEQYFGEKNAKEATEEVVLQRYSCALVSNILLQGHLYITENNFIFYSNLFGYVPISNRNIFLLKTSAWQFS